jgi:putative ABC transport system permease protein
VVERFQADTWVVREGGSGPFTSAAALPVTAADAVAALPGVERAEPVLLVRSGIPGDPIHDVNLIGIRVGGMGEPEPSDGAQLSGPGEAIVDESLDLEPGDDFRLGGQTLRVVGVAGGISYTFGVPSVWVTIEDAQRVSIGGAPAASAVVVQGTLTEAPPGFELMDDDAVIDDLERPLARGTDSIDLILVLLTITAAGIVGLIVYLSTLEKMADLAVLKATGSSKRFMATGLAVQAVLLSIVSAIVSVGLAAVIGPAFPVPLEVRADTYARLLGLALSVGLVASLAGVWRAIRVDPATAFGGR